MDHRMNAQLLRGALATVKKALEVRGLTDVDELTLYSPMLNDSPEDLGDESGDHAGNVVRDAAESSVHTETRADTAAHGADDGPEADRAPIRDPQSAVRLGQTAQELFAEMPWEPSEEPSTSEQAKDAKDDGGKADRTLDVDAAGFLSDMPWDGAGTEKEEASMSKQRADDRSIDEQESKRRDDAQDFFENLNWDGDDQIGQPAAKAGMADSGKAGSEERFSVDSDGTAVPDHVRRVVELRERDRLPKATHDAMHRSAEDEERPSEGEKE